MNVSPEEIWELAKGWIAQTGIFTLDPVWFNVLLSLGGISLVLALLVYGLTGSYRASKSEERRLRKLLVTLQPTLGLEKNATHMLELAAELIRAPVYCFYAVEPRSGQFVLKAVRHQAEDFGRIKPSYSGLVPYQKESYMPPVSLPRDIVDMPLGIVKHGEVPLLHIPIPGGSGALRIGPLKRTSRKALRAFGRFAEALRQPFETLALTESMKTQLEVSVQSSRALMRISDISHEPLQTLDMIVQTASKTLGAEGALSVLPNGGCALYGTADKAVSLERLESSPELRQRLLEQAARQDIWVAGSHALQEPVLAALQEALVGVRADRYAIVRLQGRFGVGAFVLWYGRGKHDLDPETTGRTALLTVAGDLASILDNQSSVKHLAHSNIALLKSLTRAMDNMNPYTVGYSDQMARYAIVIAKELNLPEAEIRDIALAAHLSNIGVLGLSADLYQKEGKFTEMEFELMKLHSEVGATIVNALTGNTYVAACILHHHERMDGNGYPHALRGQAIPVGSRIIAVIQTFLAKINGRKSRDPLPFDQALQMLKAASGTQLDGQVVDALIRWYDRKRRDPAVLHRALGSCWEMCCTPSSICEHCPVYGKMGVNCWETPGNLCAAHGKSCDTCFVRTETMNRKAVGV